MGRGHPPRARAPLHGPHHAGAICAAFSPDGRTLATGSYNTIQLWGLTSHPHLRASLKLTSDPEHLAFSPDGRTLAASSYDGTTRLWDVANRKQLGAPLAANKSSADIVVFSPDGWTLATVSEDRDRPVVGRGQPRQLGAPLTAHTGALYAVAMSPNGRIVASGGLDTRSGCGTWPLTGNLARH